MALFLRSHLNFSVLPAPPNTESLWCKVQLENMSLIIGVVYRPPGSDVKHLHNLNQFLQSYVASAPNIICMGDFNAPGVDWSSMTVSGHEVSIGRELIDVSLSCGLHHIVKDSTGNAAVLDLVFVTSSLANSGFECDIIDGVSDHNAVLFSVPGIVPKCRYTYCTFRDFNHADDLAITDALCDSFQEFELKSATSDVNTLSAFFESLVSKCINCFIPLKTKKTNTEIPWMTRDLLHLSRRVTRLR